MEKLWYLRRTTGVDFGLTQPWVKNFGPEQHYTVTCYEHTWIDKS